MEAQLTHLTQLVQSLHEKLDGVIEENKQLRSLFESGPKVTKKKVSRDERQQCCGLTAKGTQCKNKSIENGRCKMHLNQDSRQSQPKPKKQKKQKPAPPTHTHLPGEAPTTYCRLCETHGDILDPTLPDRRFIMTETINEDVAGPALVPEPVSSPVVTQSSPVGVLENIDDENDNEDEGDQDIISQLRNLTVQQSNWADVDDDDFFETS